MAQTLAEYLDWLDQRDLMWPQPHDPEPVAARPAIKPLPEVRAVVFEVYGTLLTTDGGELLHLHPQELRMQIALEKTVEEFNMWYSMHREPGAPWQAMLRQYRKLVQEAGMVGTKRLGDKPHVDSARIWGKLISRLIQNEYTWDSGQLGNLEQFAVKVAYFFHASLQGCSAAPEAAETLGRLQAGGIRLGLLADTQSFTLPHLLKALWGSGKMQDASTVFSSGLMTTSHQTGVRTPSPTLYAWAVKHAAKSGLEPEQVLHVSHRLGEDLAVAKEFGFRTALYAGDRLCCQVTPEQLKDPEIRPDRLITNLAQLLDIVDA